MCIIIVVPLGEKLPEKSILKNCFDNNKDGIGFMYRLKNKIRIKKGYFNFDSFYKAVQNIKNSEIIIHFRYATHGKINSGNCHPFPLSSDVKDLVNTRIDCQIGICHNGIISGAKIDDKEKLSDTMVFIRDLDIESVKEISQKVTISDGKFIIMTQFKTYMIGEFHYDNGIYYSNKGYQEKLSSVYTGFYGDVSKYDGCEMCDCCKNQYADIDVTKGNKVDPCIDCDGYLNFELSNVKEDIEFYNEEYDLIYREYLDEKEEDKRHEDWVNNVKYGVYPSCR